MFVINSELKANLQTYKIKHLHGEKIIISFLKKQLLLSKSYISYYPEPDNHHEDKVKLVVLSNYANKKELEHTTGVDTFDLDAGFYCFNS